MDLNFKEPTPSRTPLVTKSQTWVLAAQVAQWYSHWWPLPMQEIQETWFQFLSWEDPLEWETATQCSCLENSRDRRRLLGTVHGVGKNQTRLSMHALPHTTRDLSSRRNSWLAEVQMKPTLSRSEEVTFIDPLLCASLSVRYLHA